MSELYNYCHIAEQTDVGCKRAVNEDWVAHFESPNGLVAVVCDGMGGHAGGQVASHTAIETIKAFMMVEREDTPAELIVQAIDAANAHVLERASQQPELKGMGSTCVMMIVRDGRVYIGSVGDSRAYLIRNHRIRQLTVDQSYVQMLVDAGTITAQEAERHPRKNEITNAIGLQGMQPATVLPEALDPIAGDCFLLCSDGLSGMVADHDIAKVVSRQSEYTQMERVEELVNRARRNGGLDNITCQIVEFAITPGSSFDEAKPWKRFMLPLAAAAIAVGLIACGLWWWLNRDRGPKHSARVIQLMATCDSIYTLQQLEPHDGLTFMTLDIDRQLEGVKLQYHRPSGDTTIVIRNFAFQSAVATPDQSVRLVYSTDSTACDFVLTSKPEQECEVTVTLVGRDKSYMYIIPLPLPAEEPDPQPSFKAAIDPKDKPGKTSQQDDRQEKTTNNATAGGNDTTVTTATVLQVAVPVGKPDHVVTLLSKNGSNSSTRFYLNDYAFMPTSGDKGWYTIKNNGAMCVITIKNSRDNPIPDKNATIKIPTQPECNGGQGIIINVSLSK